MKRLVLLALLAVVIGCGYGKHARNAEVAELTLALEQGDSDAAMQALRTLLSKRDELGVDPALLARQMLRPDNFILEDLVSEVESALMEMEPTLEVLSVLKQGIRDAEDVRALRIVAAWGPRATSTIPAVEIVLYESPYKRRLAAETLLRIDPSGRVLVEALARGDEGTRSTAAAALAEGDDAGTLDALRLAMEDRSPYVRAAAAWARYRRGVDATVALGVAEALIQGGGCSDWLAAANLLENMGRHGTPLLEDLLAVGRRARELPLEFPDDSIDQFLRPDPCHAFRIVSLKAARAIGGTAARDYIAEAVEDERLSGVERRLARRLLEELDVGGED